MPDIAMCQNKICPLRMKCYRYRAIPTEGRQSYGSFKPYECTSGPAVNEILCDHFSEVHEHEGETKWLTPIAELR